MLCVQLPRASAAGDLRACAHLPTGTHDGTAPQRVDSLTTDARASRPTHASIVTRRRLLRRPDPWRLDRVRKEEINAIITAPSEITARSDA